MTEHTLEEQHTGLQQMFGWVLKVVDHPVEVSKEQLRMPLGGEYMIDITETDDSFIFSLAPVEVVNG